MNRSEALKQAGQSAWYDNIERGMLIDGEMSRMIKEGEVYEARRYQLDPQEKVTLIGREPDGYDPECNQYINEVAFWMQGKWMMVTDNGQYVPAKENNQ